MAGTDHRRRAAADGPAVILVEPQLGENIGTAARAMMNCALDDLRLVRPRDGWPSAKAVAAASGADAVLERARLYPSVEAAIADLVHVYAATARDRGVVRRVVTPRRAAAEIRTHLAAGEACGVLFGPERTGLLNDDVVLADTVLTIPLNPGFSSLNLAQAVLIVGYVPCARSRPEALRTLSLEALPQVRTLLGAQVDARALRANRRIGHDLSGDDELDLRIARRGRRPE